MRILSLDPGGKSGYVSCLHEDGHTSFFATGLLDKQPHHATLWSLLTISSPDVLICERFNYQRRDLEDGVSLVLISREYIGICELYTQTHPFCTLVMQQPSCMQLFSDDMLRRCGEYETQKDVRAAKKHMLYYLTNVVGDQKYIRATRRA